MSKVSLQPLQKDAALIIYYKIYIRKLSFSNTYFTPTLILPPQGGGDEKWEILPQGKKVRKDLIPPQGGV
jgi:hypothetical protein